MCAIVSPVMTRRAARLWFGEEFGGRGGSCEGRNMDVAEAYGVLAVM